MLGYRVCDFQLLYWMCYWQIFYLIYRLYLICFVCILVFYGCKMNYLFYVQNKKFFLDVEIDIGEVSDDEEVEMEEIIEIMINGDYKFERQNSRYGSFKR